MSFELRYSNSIADVKELIQRKNGIPVDRIRLIFDGKDIGDRDLLSDHILSHNRNTMIYSERRSDEFLFVKTLSGKTFKVDYNPAYLVQFVKEMIQDKDGIPTHQQSLIFGGVKLDRVFTTLLDYGIAKGSTLHLTLYLGGGMQNFIKTLTGKTVSQY